jgi:hypothetical protein
MLMIFMNRMPLLPLQDALKELWKLAYPDRQIPPLKSDLWKEMGWQNSDPSTDFRFIFVSIDT